MRNTEPAAPDQESGSQRRRSGNAGKRAGSGASSWLDRLGVALAIATVLLISSAMTGFAANHATSATSAPLAQAGDCPTGGGLDHLGKISCHLDQGLTHVDTLSAKLTNVNSISPKINCGLNGTNCSTSATTTATTPPTATTTTTPATTTTTTTSPPTRTAATSTTPTSTTPTTTPPTPPQTTPPTPPEITPPTPPTTPLVVTVPPAAVAVVATGTASTSPPQAALAPVLANTATETGARPLVNTVLPAPPIAASNPISYVQPASFPSTGAGGAARLVAPNGLH